MEKLPRLPAYLGALYRYHRSIRAGRRPIYGTLAILANRGFPHRGDTTIIKSDRWIYHYCTTKRLITPFESRQIRELVDVSGPIKAISYGLTSYGYDLTADPQGLEAFTPLNGAAEIDPKHFDRATIGSVRLLGNEQGERWWVLPPHTYANIVSREYIRMPRSVLGLCVGKSTYTRCGLLVNTTPLEPEWEGNLVIEIANAADLPIRVYANEGIAQVLFFDGEDCLVSYKDRAGKYQGQTGIQVAKV